MKKSETLPNKSIPQHRATKPKSIQITYEDNQWSPKNPTGEKFYKRNQLLSLRCAAESQAIPKLKAQYSSLMRINLMPTFAKKMQMQQQQQQQQMQHHQLIKKRSEPKPAEKGTRKS